MMARNLVKEWRGCCDEELREGIRWQADDGGRVQRYIYSLSLEKPEALFIVRRTVSIRL